MNPYDWVVTLKIPKSVKSRKVRNMAQPQKSEIIHLKQSLDVQSGAVVSKTLVNEKSGTITLFAFDQNEGLSEHEAPYDASVYVLEGNLEITISGKPYLLQADDMIIMPANQPHALNAKSPVKLLLVMIRS
jgi:quercetin dioxygenase-like cupin family protein